MRNLLHAGRIDGRNKCYPARREAIYNCRDDFLPEWPIHGPIWVIFAIKIDDHGISTSTSGLFDQWMVE